jgi:hypothetical protein
MVTNICDRGSIISQKSVTYYLNGPLVKEVEIDVLGMLICKLIDRAKGLPLHHLEW